MAKVNFMTKEEEQWYRDGWSRGPYPLPKEYQDRMIAQMRGGEDKELKKQAGFIGAEDLYSSDGDDYTIDDNAFANAKVVLIDLYLNRERIRPRVNAVRWSVSRPNLRPLYPWRCI